MDYRKLGRNLSLLGLALLLIAGYMYIYWMNNKEGQSEEASRLRTEVIDRGSMDARRKLDAMYERDETRPERIDYALFAGLGLVALGFAVRSAATSAKSSSD